MVIDARNGDAVSLLRDIPNESVDLVIADPPYNLGKDYGNNQDSKGFDEYIDFSREWIYEAKRILSPKGSIYVFMGVRFISFLYDVLEREFNFHFNSWIVWHYTQGMGKTRGFSPRHDDILFFTKGKDFLITHKPPRP
jgi:site-specific DNA-methyltransferase (adenine-specific)